MVIWFWLAIILRAAYSFLKHWTWTLSGASDSFKEKPAVNLNNQQIIRIACVSAKCDKTTLQVCIKGKSQFNGRAENANRQSSSAGGKDKKV